MKLCLHIFLPTREIAEYMRKLTALLIFFRCDGCVGMDLKSVPAPIQRRFMETQERRYPTVMTHMHLVAGWLI